MSCAWTGPGASYAGRDGWLGAGWLCAGWVQTRRAQALAASPAPARRGLGTRAPAPACCLSQLRRAMTASPAGVRQGAAGVPTSRSRWGVQSEATLLQPAGCRPTHCCRCCCWPAILGCSGLSAAAGRCVLQGCTTLTRRGLGGCTTSAELAAPPALTAAAAAAAAAARAACLLLARSPPDTAVPRLACDAVGPPASEDMGTAAAVAAARCVAWCCACCASASRVARRALHASTAASSSE